MNANNMDEWKWTSNTLARTNQQARRTLIRTKRRNFRYSEPIKHATSGIKEPMVHTTLDDAFANVMKSLSDSSRQCLRYYRSTNPSDRNDHDKQFCSKYLKSKYFEVQPQIQLEEMQGLNVVVAPGTYTITAGSAADGATQQTHVVKMRQGEVTTLDFNF